MSLTLNEYQERTHATSIVGQSVDKVFEPVFKLLTSNPVLYSWTLRVRRAMRLQYLVLKLNGESGEIAEEIGKSLRDDHLEYGRTREAKIKKELGDALWYISEIAQEFGWSLEEVAQDNLDKLADRAERGVLQGEGSER